MTIGKTDARTRLRWPRRNRGSTSQTAGPIAGPRGQARARRTADRANRSAAKPSNASLTRLSEADKPNDVETSHNKSRRCYQAASTNSHVLRAVRQVVTTSRLSQKRRPSSLTPTNSRPSWEIFRTSAGRPVWFALAGSCIRIACGLDRREPPGDPLRENPGHLDATGFAAALNVVPCFTPIRSPESNGMSASLPAARKEPPRMSGGRPGVGGWAPERAERSRRKIPAKGSLNPCRPTPIAKA